MSTAQKIQELTNIISKSNDSKLINLVYALVKEYQENGEMELFPEQQKDLGLRIEKRKSGETKSMTWEEVEIKLKAI